MSQEVTPHGAALAVWMAFPLPQQSHSQIAEPPRLWGSQIRTLISALTFCQPLYRGWQSISLSSFGRIGAEVWSGLALGGILSQAYHC